MAEDVREKLATERTVNLPRHVSFFTRQSRKGLPAPACAVALERGIRIPMPDGTHQIADRYIPQTGEPCPTLLVRTPYGRGFPYDFMYGGLFAEHGYHVLLQSTRGTGGSGGSFEPFTGEAADAQATIAWLREQSWFNGSLATIGASYLGFTQWALANDPPPELKAMIVQVSTEDFYGFLYPGGAFAMEATLTGVAAMLSQDKGFRPFIGAVLRLMLTFRKVTRMLPLVPGYKLAFGKRVGYLEDWLAHPAAGDRYWGPRRADPDISSLPPVHLLGGWYDVVIDGTLDSYRRLREAGRTVRLVVGPWNHTSGFSKDMPIIAGEALAWLRAHLTGNGDAPGPAPVRVHVSETGGKGQWRDLADWPPPEAIAQSWHLHPGGTLADSLARARHRSASTRTIRRPRSAGRAWTATASARRTTASWRHATTSSSSPARSSVNRKRSSARSASGCGSAAAARTSTSSPGCATWTPRARRGTSATGCYGWTPRRQPTRTAGPRSRFR